MLSRAWSDLQASIPLIFTTTIRIVGILMCFRAREKELLILSDPSTDFSEHCHISNEKATK